MTMRVLFRVDASATMGGGHWLRSLALAQACQEQGGEVQWCYQQSPANLLARLQQLAIPAYGLQASAATLEDARQTADWAIAQQSDWLVLDGYHFDHRYRQALKQFLPEQVRTLWIDDLNQEGAAELGWVLNTTPQAHYQDYGPAQRLAGLDFVLLRQDYWQRPSRSVSPTSLFINFGATDAFGLTLPTLKLLKEMDFSGSVEVVTGPGMVAWQEVEQYCQQQGYKHQHDLLSLTPSLQRSRLALTAAGSTLLELAYWQVPSVLLVVADNQLEAAHLHAERGWCEVFDVRLPNHLAHAVARAIQLWHQPSGLAAMQQRADGLVDGQGARRVARLMQQALT